MTDKVNAVEVAGVAEGEDVEEAAVEAVVTLLDQSMTRLRKSRGSGRMRTKLPEPIIVGRIREGRKWQEGGSRGSRWDAMSWVDVVGCYACMAR